MIDYLTKVVQLAGPADFINEEISVLEAEGYRYKTAKDNYLILVKEPEEEIKAAEKPYVLPETGVDDL